MSQHTRVLLVEDDAMLRASLESYLGLVGYSVTAVGDSLAYYRCLSEGDFAVAVIDLGLPDQSGKILVDYTRHNTTSSIIVITARDTLETRVDCYQTGADLFLGKPFDGRELAAAIASLASRREQISDRLSSNQADASAWRLLIRQHRLQRPDGQLLELTPKECQLLELLARGDGDPVPRSTLLTELYGRVDESAARALETLVRRTRQKIANHHPGPSPILTQHGLGYALVVPCLLDRSRQDA
ncbi:response regulator transcription factor [Allochromatium palmeri]|uniref:Response regulator n=1 Tax=Allochromatium palmeri TaxID=231048 RepID=A0A6N8E9C7_9GAMM|nr:response regulator transcription factor [Allochromatium palmeri]MTW19928.1 response regulator [Allochromatium palmeri]